MAPAPPRDPAALAAPTGAAARWLPRLAFAYAALVLVVALVPERPLGHDEAVYAVGARGLWSGNDADEFGLHRSIGMRLLAAPGVAMGGDERVIRLPFALLALGYLAAIYAITRRWFGVPAAALAVAVQATTAPWLWRAAEALSDIPSALAVLGLVGLCAVGDHGGGRRAVARAMLAGALAATACYLRYASAPVVAATFALTLIVDPRRWRWLAIAALTGAVGIAPFLVWSVARTGAVLGVLEVGERMAQRRYYGEGLVFYVKAWPLLLAGPIGGAVAAIGVVAGVTGWRRQPAAPSPAVRARRLFGAVAVAQIGLLGWRVHGEVRFVFLATTLLIIIGCAWLAADHRRWRLAVAAVALTALPSAIWTWAHLDRRAASWRPFLEAMTAIEADAAGASCLIFATEAPMATWYTGCRAIQVDAWGFDVRRAVGATHIYLVEARGLRRSINQTEAATRPALGWRPLRCGDRERWCLWRATTPPPS